MEPNRGSYFTMDAHMLLARTGEPRLDRKDGYDTFVSTSFCTRCTSMISSERSRCDFSEGLTFSSHHHHHDEASLHAAAMAGCYVCVRIWDDLSQTPHISPSTSISCSSPHTVPLTTYTMNRTTSDMVEIQIALRKQVREFVFRSFCFYSSQVYLSPPSLPPSTYMHQKGYLESWLGKCTTDDQNHVKCHEFRVKGFTPYRILEFRDDRSCRVIVPTEDDVEVASYTTLSYCWGPGTFMKLTSQTYLKFRSWMPTSDLPQVFQDAIAVTRDLQIRFIWIDAMCIVQDSKEDYGRQCSEMSLIYMNTSCNIAAAFGGNPNVSMFRQRGSGKGQIGRFGNEDGPDGRNTDSWTSLDSVFDMDYFKDLRDAPLFSRGWILQELVLSPRTLYFGKDHTHWHCRCHEACDIWPQGNPYLMRGKVEPSAFLFKHRPGDLQSRRWNDIVEKYTRLKLSHAEDRLVALSGLAKAFQSWTSDEYLAGHWKSQLRVSLNWTPRPYYRLPATPTPSVAPSWSWASIEGDIYSELPAGQETILCDVRSVTVEPSAGDVTGRLLSGRLALMAPSKRAMISGERLVYLPELEKSAHVRLYTFWSSERQLPADICAELALTYVHFREVGHVVDDYRECEMEAKSLVLIPSDSECGDYERVATLSITSRFPLDSAPSQDVLRPFGLNISKDTREVTSTQRTCYREFNIV